MKIGFVVPSTELPLWIKKVEFRLTDLYPDAQYTYFVVNQATGYSRFAIPNYPMFSKVDQRFLSYSNSPFQIVETIKSSPIERVDLLINLSFLPWEEENHHRKIDIIWGQKEEIDQSISELHQYFLHQNEVLPIQIKDSNGSSSQFVEGVNQMSLSRTLHDLLHRVNMDVLNHLSGNKILHYPLENTAASTRQSQWQLLAAIAKGFYRRKFKPSRWEVILKNRTTNEITTISSTKEYFYADPFLASEQGVEYLFLEKKVYQTDKAHLVVRSSSDDFQEEVEILNTEYHLSYPNVFSLGGKWYMMPESSENHSLDLYESQTFPYQWHKVGTILQDIEIVDATLLFYEDKYYLFCTKKYEKDSSTFSELLIYYTDDFLSFDWKIHSQPKTVDPRFMRQGGNFIFEQEKVIRVTQDNSKSYGRQINFFEIDELNPNSFKEHLVKQIKPESFSEQYSGIHTYNEDQSFEVVDALQI